MITFFRHRQPFAKTKLLLIFLIGIVVSRGHANEGGAVTTLSDSANPPPSLSWCVDHLPERHEFTPEGLAGPAVDFMRLLADTAGFTLEFSQDTPFARCLRAMRQGSHDIMVSLNISDERKKYMHMLPLYPGIPEGLFQANNRPLLAKNKDGVKGARLGLVNGYVYNTSDINTLTSNNNVETVNSVEDGLILLLFDELDAVLAPRVATGTMIRQHPRYKHTLSLSDVQLKASGERFVALAISKNSGVSESLIESIVRAIAELQRKNLVLSVLFPEVAHLYKDELSFHPPHEQARQLNDFPSLNIQESQLPFDSDKLTFVRGMQQIKISDIFSLKSLLLDGAGWAVISKHQCAEEIEDGRLEQIVLEDVESSIEAEVRVFRQHARQHGPVAEFLWSQFD